ncbi:MAG TPA: response regulator [Hymenobacter sp.]|jgi:CheY-like chemotaxis protein|nr:response regulator [Hymenobacter sp.]HLL97311.1 response regulator [Spirosoma sp.]
MKPPLDCPSVWIVDDDEDDQLIIQSAFGDADLSIKVLLLNDGTELLPKLDECTELPRLILLDVNMPRKNGFETLKELRSIPAFADLPVIMLTTSADKADRERSLSLGATRFLTKPLTYPQLKALTQELSQQWQLS